MYMTRISRTTPFISWHKVDDACHIANIFFKKIIRLCKLLRSIVFDRDSKILSHFYRPYGENLELFFFFYIMYHLQANDQTKVISS